MKQSLIIHCPYCEAYYTPQQLGTDFAPGIKATVICGADNVGCGKHFDVAFYEENVLDKVDIFETQPKPGIVNRLMKKTHEVKVGEKAVVVGKKLSASIKKRANG